MVDFEPLRPGRTPFEPRGTDHEYSGLSISDRYLTNADLRKSFFNGTNLTNCAFGAVQLNNSEFSEASVGRCHFEATDLSGCDFVDCLIENTTFINSVFEDGEWRDTTFVNCLFVLCTFAHTTIALCRFVECEFDADSLKSAEHRAIYFNVFTSCRFARLVADPVFASRNFGIPAISTGKELVTTGRAVSIEQICLLNNLGRLRVAMLADVAEVICSSLGGKTHRRNSTLTFFSNIVRILTDERRISATSLIYLEELITRFATTVDDQDLFMAAMSSVIEIRSALFSVTAESAARPDAGNNVRGVTIVFSPAYVRRQVEAFRDALAEAAGISGGELEIKKIEPGSTFIELASAAILSTGALLSGLNFVLRQATVTIERLAQLQRSVRQFNVPTVQPKPKRPAKKKPAKATAIMRTGTVAPELAPVRTAVRRNGRVLVEMDEPARVNILSEQAD
jgi:hypothetical protein